MSKIFYIIILVFAGLFLCKKGVSQVDPHSSQYYMNPLFINPANGGMFNGSYRVAAVYRNQWRSITNAFSTIALTADLNTEKNINFGINILNQSAGDAGYNFFNGYFSVAYSGIRFGKGNKQQISLGLQAGIIRRKVDPSKFKFGDQWNPITGYDPSNTSNDVLATSSASSFDAGAGILYFDGDDDKKINPYLGFSAFHLSKPKDPFIDKADKKNIPVRYAVHGGISLTLSDVVTVVPNLLYMRQGAAEEKMVGAYAALYAGTDVDLLIGANYRFNDAVSPFAGFTVKRFTVGLSYDANISSLGKMAGNASNFELTLSYIGKRKDKPNLNYLKCPRL
ncbi:MAG: PorP/SprF family type IX secretion system membrane protein [Ferruginibacter sp.]